PPSTLSDANIKRNSAVFGELYGLLYQHYKAYLSDSCFSLPINGEVDAAHVKLFDATTITLFVDVFKGVGRNPLNGKRKGGLKVQAQMPLSDFVPDLITLTEGSCNIESRNNRPVGTECIIANLQKNGQYLYTSSYPICFCSSKSHQFNSGVLGRRAFQVYHWYC
ncbi:MAG: hypothetical protein ACKOEV_16460, partial [Cytophagales bacterium]